MRLSAISAAVMVSLGVPACFAAAEPGPLTKARLVAAAEAAGFRVREAVVDAPAAVRPGVPFETFDYDHADLALLRRKYELEKVVAPAKDEWNAQLLLNQWLFQKIPGGNPRVSANRALEILDYASKGEKFYCSHFAASWLECGQALGWQTRRFGVDRMHGPETLGSTHHGVAEVWSNQFRKWVVMDAQSNLHFAKNGIPLSALEIRAEWLKDKGAAVAHVVGIPPNATHKNPAIVWWKRADEDETATYFWLNMADTAGPDVAKPGRKMFFLQDDWNNGLIWFQNDYESGRSRLHTGYIRDQFIPVRDIAGMYWTVGVVEARLTGAADRVIRLALDSYCPNRTGYEMVAGAGKWERIADPGAVSWALRPGWNTLVLRTVGRREVRGPETSMLLYLE